MSTGGTYNARSMAIRAMRPGRWPNFSSSNFPLSVALPDLTQANATRMSFLPGEPKKSPQVHGTLATAGGAGASTGMGGGLAAFPLWGIRLAKCGTIHNVLLGRNTNGSTPYSTFSFPSQYTLF